MIEIAAGDPRPLFRQIVDGLRRRVASGELAAGTRLPSVRALAMQLVINPNTVAKAYAELTSEGVIEAQKGVGLFVAAQRQRLSDAERERRLAEAIEQMVSAVLPLDFPPEVVAERLRAELAGLLDHAAGAADGDSFADVSEDAASTEAPGRESALAAHAASSAETADGADPADPAGVADAADAADTANTANTANTVIARIQLASRGRRDP